MKGRNLEVLLEAQPELEISRYYRNTCKFIHERTLSAMLILFVLSRKDFLLQNEECKLASGVIIWGQQIRRTR